MAKKIEQGQKFLEDGRRIPVTKLAVDGNVVVKLKTLEKDFYSAVQLGFEKRIKPNAPKSTKSPYRFLREVRMADGEAAPSVGEVIKASAIFKPGDVVNVTGISKGKGYAGGVKRYHFKGGPRTHGQSDRERAPGSIGSNTTPGRVWKGKRMAGRMGHDRVTVRNLIVAFVDNNFILVKGLVPGGRNNLLMLKKVGVDNKFVPLYQEVSASDAAEAKVEKVSEVSKGDAKVDVKDEPKMEEVNQGETKDKEDSK